jgi:hypothetical protein
MNRLLLLACLVAAAPLWGCETQDGAPATAEGALVVTEGSHEAEITLNPLGDVDLLPTIEPPTRARQRLNIDQLSASFERVTGGLNWTDGGNVLWESLSATLGKPDFAEMTQEDLLPSALFHKFLDDAARQVCTALVAAEVSGEAAAQHLFVEVSPQEPMADAESVDANLRHLLLAFHGKRFGADAPDLIHWRWLLHTVDATSADPTAGWNAVCVALFTHPHFYSY